MQPKNMKIFLIIWIILTIAGPLWILCTKQIDFHADYRTANRASAHLAPDPNFTKEAVIQAYAARAFNWRGIFATHTWIAIKPKDAKTYIVYQIIGWRKYYGFPALTIIKDIPDRYWFNHKPTLILDIRGTDAEKLIPQIDHAARTYPYADDYDLWPGPNSNTFPAYIARKVPALHLVMPANAIGKDFLAGMHFFAKAPSGTGYQLSLLGALGILMAKKEGIEINILGFVYGIRFSPFAILLPGVGEIL